MEECEDLQENPFLVAFQNHKKLVKYYDSVAQINGIVCVPLAKTLPSSSRFTAKRFAQKHILKPVEDGNNEQFVSLAGKKVELKGGHVFVDEGRSGTIVSKVLFEELHYDEDFNSFRVFCLEIPLDVRSNNQLAKSAAKADKRVKKGTQEVITSSVHFIPMESRSIEDHWRLIKDVLGEELPERCIQNNPLVQNFVDTMELKLPPANNREFDHNNGTDENDINQQQQQQQQLLQQRQSNGAASDGISQSADPSSNSNNNNNDNNNTSLNNMNNIPTRERSRSSMCDVNGQTRRAYLSIIDDKFKTTCESLVNTSLKALAESKKNKIVVGLSPSLCLSFRLAVECHLHYAVHQNVFNVLVKSHLQIEKETAKKLVALSSADMASLGVAHDLANLCNVDEAVNLLKSLNNYVTPIRRLGCLKAVEQALVACVRSFRSESDRKGSSGNVDGARGPELNNNQMNSSSLLSTTAPTSSSSSCSLLQETDDDSLIGSSAKRSSVHIVGLSTDDLFPLFVYTLIQSKLNHIHANLEYLRAFAPSSDTLGTTLASGLEFRLANLEAAVAFLQDFDSSLSPTAMSRSNSLSGRTSSGVGCVGLGLGIRSSNDRYSSEQALNILLDSATGDDEEDFFESLLSNDQAGATDTDGSYKKLTAKLIWRQNHNLGPDTDTEDDQDEDNQDEYDDHHNHDHDDEHDNEGIDYIDADRKIRVLHDDQTVQEHKGRPRRITSFSGSHPSLPLPSPRSANNNNDNSSSSSKKANSLHARHKSATQDSNSIATTSTTHYKKKKNKPGKTVCATRSRAALFGRTSEIDFLYHMAQRDRKDLINTVIYESEENSAHSTNRYSGQKEDGKSNNNSSHINADTYDGHDDENNNSNNKNNKNNNK